MQCERLHPTDFEYTQELPNLVLLMKSVNRHLDSPHIEWPVATALTQFQSLAE